MNSGNAIGMKMSHDVISAQRQSAHPQVRNRPGAAGIAPAGLASLQHALNTGPATQALQAMRSCLDQRRSPVKRAPGPLLAAPVIQPYFTYNGKRQRSILPEIISLFQGSEGFNGTLADYKKREADPDTPTDLNSWYYQELTARGWNDHAVEPRGNLNLSLSGFIGNYFDGRYNLPEVVVGPSDTESPESVGNQSTAPSSGEMTEPISPNDVANHMAMVIGVDKTLAYRFFSFLDVNSLWQFAQTSQLGREMAQKFVMTYFPRYEDRFAFNLATKGLLLRTRPSVKYGGAEEKESYPEHATSGYQWYSGALRGRGVIVLGDLNDYMLMRDYNTLKNTEMQAKAVESNASFLMAWPWSLLVNAALVTGAIHGARQIVGATEISQKTVYKPPDMKDTFGMTVYAREMIQLVLKHKYRLSTQTDEDEAQHLGYPQPATGGGYLATPTLDPYRRANSQTPYATIFDVGEAEEKKYSSPEGAGDLVDEINPPTYGAIRYPKDTDKILKTDQKSESKNYAKLRKALKRRRDTYTKPGGKRPPAKVPEKLTEMLGEIYPQGEGKASPPGSVRHTSRPWLSSPTTDCSPGPHLTERPRLLFCRPIM